MSRYTITYEENSWTFDFDCTYNINYRGNYYFGDFSKFIIKIIGGGHANFESGI